MPACRTACRDLDSDRRVGIGDIQAVAARWRLTADPDPDGDPNTPNDLDLILTFACNSLWVYTN